MKKELKEFIKKMKLSDEEILKKLQLPDASAESDVKDEADTESADQTDSEESEHAEGAPAQKETPKKGLSPADLTKMIAETVAAAFKAEREAQLLPSQKPIPEPQKVKKTEPKPKTQTTPESITDSNGQLVF